MNGMKIHAGFVVLSQSRGLELVGSSAVVSCMSVIGIKYGKGKLAAHAHAYIAGLVMPIPFMRGNMRAFVHAYP